MTKYGIDLLPAGTSSIGSTPADLFHAVGLKTPHDLRRCRTARRILALALVLPTVFAVFLIAPLAIQFVHQTVSQVSPLLQLVGLHPGGSSVVGQITASYQSKAATLTQIIQSQP